MAIDIDAIFDSARGDSFELYAQHVNPQWTRVLRTLGFDRRYVRGEGAYLWDDAGNRYLDFMSGWGVFNFGRNHPAIRAALAQVLAADRPGWVAFDAPPLAVALAARLKERMPGKLDYVYFCNSGTECTEAAIKMARAATGRPGIVHLKRAFHGLTLGALSANGDESFRQGFEPFLPGGVEVPLGDVAALEQALAGNDIAAFVFEPIQGKGVYLPPPGYLLEAQRLCRAHGTLMICDEIQTGMGRTGRFLACEWEPGLDPDFVLLAKALSGGYVPVGAVLMRADVHRKVYTSMERAMAHACTFGMGDLAMAAGLASLAVLDDEDLLANAVRMGQLFADGLRAMQARFEMIGEVRQRGLMIGIELKKPKSLGLKTAWNMIHACDGNLFPQAVVMPLFDDHRILTQVAGHNLDVIKLLPPLCITATDVRVVPAGVRAVHGGPAPVPRAGVGADEEARQERHHLALTAGSVAGLGCMARVDRSALLAAAEGAERLAAWCPRSGYGECGSKITRSSATTGAQIGVASVIQLSVQ